MRNYTAESYEGLVEHINDETLQQYMHDEQEFLKEVEEASERTFIDLGAGYGRVEPLLSTIARDVIAIEINPEMYRELEQRVSSYPNVSAKQGDFLKLHDELPANGLIRPVFLILQNSLGTIEGGDSNQVINTVVSEAKDRGGELILSLLRQPALANWGVSMYGKLEPMVGRVDMDKSDFEGGVMVSDTGYSTKWWTNSDIDHFRQLGRVVRECQTAEYQLLQLVFS